MRLSQHVNYHFFFISLNSQVACELSLKDSNLLTALLDELDLYWYLLGALRTVFD